MSALEVVILAPVVLLILAVIIYAGRRQAAAGDLEAAAQTGARTISIARDPHAATDAAQTAARDTVDVGSVRCQSLSFSATIDDETVTVNVACQVATRDLIGVIPVGSVRITATATEVLDVWRERP